MADIFISYSRKDKDFVLRLNEALKSRGREAWVDWEDILPSEEFTQVVFGAIESADTFVCVLSPDFIASAVCRREVAHAAANNKRIVPIIVRDVDAKAVPQELGELNWIICEESDDFEKAIDTLIGALDYDIDWVRLHTRLLIRANEWEAKGRDNSLVLRGDDLQSAEQWLVEKEYINERHPTRLQIAYIMASRAAFSAVQSPVEPIRFAFFSYAHEDAEFALRLAKDLRAGGAAVWMDRLDIQPRSALGRCDRGRFDKVFPPDGDSFARLSTVHQCDG